MKKVTKPKYGLWHTVFFMVNKAQSNVKKLIPTLLVWVLATVAISLIELYIAPVIINKVEMSVGFYELMITIGLFTLGMFLITGIQTYAEFNSHTLQTELRNHLKNQVNKKACLLSYPTIMKTETVHLLDRVNQTLRWPWMPGQRIWITLATMLSNFVSFGIYLILLTNLNWILIVIALVCSVLAYIFSHEIYNVGNEYRKKMSEHRAHLFYVNECAESVQLAKDIRIYEMDSWLHSIWKRAWKKYMGITLTKEKIYFWAYIQEGLFGLLRNAAVYAYLVYLVINRGMSAAEFLLYVGAINGFSKWVTGFLQNYLSLYRETAEVSDVKEFLELKDEFIFEGGKSIPKADKWEIRLDNVSFCYPGSGEYIFKNLNLTIKAGEKLAIVGLNGAGKTSLVRLICGFYDPDEGRVLLNGEDIREYNRREYYSLFSAVFQKFSIPDITVEQNVSQKICGIDREKVWDCLDKAGLCEKISSLPKGVETTVGRKVDPEGVLLSGGETQRLMLARALYKDGQILILDEPTAALDPLAEHDIYMKYNEMTKGKTSVFISHRLASTRFCDRIIFLAEGTIAEEGTHEQLIGAGGQYAKLFDVQSQYYREGGGEDE